MRILICNERFLFRFGVDRVLLLYANNWRSKGHEVILMGNKMDSAVVDKCSDRFIEIPSCQDYYNSNEFVADYLKKNWDLWFDTDDAPDIALVAGWPFYMSLGFLREKCGCCILHDYGGVPSEGMSEGAIMIQEKLKTLKKENSQFVNKIIAISSFVEETQSKVDVIGNVKTSHVLLGVDHLDFDLWTSQDLNKEQSNIVDTIKKYKNDGYKLIFQPGRWEKNNYKNSYASIDVARFLRSKDIKFKILVLSNEDSLSDIPEDVKDSYCCLGFLDDNDMKKVMMLSDAGFSPTLWEGFDLPLGEMQYLDKPMFVLNIGAHPEVVVDSHFLCENIDELSVKLYECLNGTFSIDNDYYKDKYNTFRSTFTWENSSNEMLNQLIEAKQEDITLIIDVTNCCHEKANTGVARVTRKVSKYLQKRAKTIFVVWDNIRNRYYFPNKNEINLLCSYGGPDKNQIDHMSLSTNRVSLDSMIRKIRGKKYHLFPEVVNGAQLEKAISYLHHNGITVGSIFYDAIPVERPDLCDKTVTDNHKVYMINLAKSEIIFPIAEHNKISLEKYWKENNVEGTTVETVLLGAQMEGVERFSEKHKDYDTDNIKILFVSTLEPRKNHIRLLKGFDIMMKKHPELSDKIHLCMIGNKYVNNNEIPDFVNQFCEEHENVEWLGVVNDELLKQKYLECSFTVYPSEVEGFGMPIIESVWYGKPCLCSDSGSIGELARIGGCCVTDVLNPESIAKSLYKLCTDKNYYLKLQNEACERNVTSWEEYANRIFDLLISKCDDILMRDRDFIPDDIKIKICEWFDKSDRRKTIFVSNQYPPNFIGGAEIIAHKQVKELYKNNYVKPIVFSVCNSLESDEGDVTFQMYDNIPIVRVCVNQSRFGFNSINFFNEAVNNVFNRLCEIVKPEIVHCHNMIGTSLGIIDIAKMHNAKTIVTLHDHWGVCYRSVLLNQDDKLCGDIIGCSECDDSISYDGVRIPIDVRKQYFRKIFEKIDAYISPSNYLANNYIKSGVDYHKMNVIWNGIDLEKFANIKKTNSSKIRILFVGIFSVHKGVELLIRAVGKSKYKNDIEIVLVGSGQEKHNYINIAEEFGIKDSLTFLGKIENNRISEAYEKADIYCLPSICAENQPVSVTEAMACGLPVIVSDIGGSKELVVDGETGFVFKHGNVEDLTSKIDILCDNRDLIESFGKKGKELINNFSFKNQVRLINRLYDNIDVSSIDCKKIIAFKGTQLPYRVNKLTEKDVLLLDWLIAEEDLKNVTALVLLSHQALNRKDVRLLEKHNITLIVEDNQYEELKKQGIINIINYSDYSELIELIPNL